MGEAHFFVHSNYLAFESTRHARRAKRDPYKALQAAMTEAYLGASIRVLAQAPNIGVSWKPTEDPRFDLTVKTRQYQGYVPRAGRDSIGELVRERSIDRAVLHGMFVGRCLDHFASSIEEVDKDIEVTYGVVGVRRDDVPARQRSRLTAACEDGDMEDILGRLGAMLPPLDDDEVALFTPDTKVFMV